MVRKIYRLMSLVGWLTFAAWLVASPGCMPRYDANGFAVEAAEAWQVETLESAVVEWAAHGLEAHIDGGDSRVTFVHDLACRNSTPEEVDACCEHNVRHGTSKIRVDAALEPARMRAVLLHELCHHWGCRDTDEPGHVMSAWTDADHLTAYDLECAGGTI